MYKLILLFIACILSIATPACYADAFDYAIIQTALHQDTPTARPLTIISGKQVRMAVFTEKDMLHLADKTLAQTIWATAEPDVKRLCTAYVHQQTKPLTHKQLSLWLAQLLGLPPTHAESKHFVVLSVPVIQAYYGSSTSAIGLFRPCTDPRIGPHADHSPVCPKEMRANDHNIASDFKTWFINTSIDSYQTAEHQGMPWTEYGFTYNWNPTAKSIDGAAEFIILKNTPVAVLPNPTNTTTAYISPEQYCS